MSGAAEPTVLAEVAVEDTAGSADGIARPAPLARSILPSKWMAAWLGRLPRGFVRRLVGYLWGYDYFISYHWASGGKYAVRLARMLSDLGFDCFLDRSEYAMGDDWRKQGASTLRDAQRLVLVATREAVMSSEPVLREIEGFSGRAKHIIPIYFGELFSAADQQNSRVLTLLGPSRLALIEETARRELGPLPTGPVIAGITGSDRILRRRALRARIVLVVIAALLAAAVTSTLLWRASENSKAAVLREIGLQLQESGRQALLDGDAARALSFLLGALDHGIDTVALRMMIADAAYVPALTVKTRSDIRHAAFNSAGTAFVTADDERATVWHSATGRSIFQPGVAAVWAAFDPTGNRLITSDAYPDGRPRSGNEAFSVWDTTTKSLLVGPIKFDDAYQFPSFSQNGAFIYSTTPMGIPHKWDAGSGASVTPILRELGGYEVMPAGSSRVFSPLDGFIPSSPLAMRFKNPETAWETTLGGPAPGPQDRQFQVFFAQDNTRLITTSWRTARVWDANRGQPLGPPVFHDGIVNAVDLSRDGRRLLTGSADKTARVWEVETGTPLIPPLLHDGPVTRVIFSPAADRAITQSNGAFYHWNANTGAIAAKLGPGSDAAYGPDGARIVARVSDSIIRIFGAATGVAVPESPTDARGIGAYAISPNGRMVLTTRGDHARVWDAATGLPLTPAIQPVQSISFSPDGASLLGMSGRRAFVWSLAGRLAPMVDIAQGEEIVSASFSPDGRHIITANRGGTARVWNTETGAPTTPPLEHGAEVCGVTFNRSGTTVLTAGRANNARLWDAATGRELTPPLDGWFNCQPSPDSFDADGRFVVGQANLGGGQTRLTARLWDARTGTFIRDYPVEVPSLVSISPDGTRIVTTTWFTAGGRWAQLWDTSTARLVASLTNDGIVAKFSADSKRLVVGGNSSARVWNARTGTAVSPEMPGAHVQALAFNSTGSRVVMGGNDRTAQVWDADTGTPTSPPLEHPLFVTKVSFGEDDSVVVTLVEREAVRVWDAGTGKPLRPVLRYGNGGDLDYAPNGAVIAVPVEGGVRLLRYPIERRSPGKLQTLGRCAPFALVNSTLVDNAAVGPCTSD